ncbi:MAG: transketolase [Nitrospinae bacterium]|nr:transketolase [Nitrospinota bacterium]
MEEDRVAELKEIARQVRIDILKMLAKAGSGHTGGSLSAVEIVTALYFAKMRHNPERPDWEERDRFVLSKGHGVPVLYAVLGRCGYFDRKHFETLRQLGSLLQGHPYSGLTPGIEVSTGSLGQGLSQANGIALATRLNRKDCRVYVLLGDGESQEGLIWEAAMTSAHYKIDHLCAITDNNGLQIDGPVSKVMAVEPIARKWEAFGWHVLEVDGHRFEEILAALDCAENTKGRPTMIVAHTVKGKGVSFMENQVKYHGTVPTPQELELALKELQV